MSTYVDHSNDTGEIPRDDVRQSAYLRRMQDLGVFDEADAMFDSVEQGKNPCDAAADVDDVIRRARALH